MEDRHVPSDKLVVGQTYWLDTEKDEYGVFVKMTPQAVWFKGDSAYYGKSEDGLIPLPHWGSFIECDKEEDREPDYILNP